MTYTTNSVNELVKDKDLENIKRDIAKIFQLPKSLLFADEEKCMFDGLDKNIATGLVCTCKKCQVR